MDRFMRLPEVQAIVGLSRSRIYALMQRGGFPKAVKLSDRAIGWRESAIAVWASEREALSRH